jgi:CBS domain containing-hemolysin-like protein
VVKYPKLNLFTNIMTTQIFLLVLLLILSGFFSGSETAIISLSNARVRTLVTEKRKNSRILDLLKRDPHKLLITILIGNNLVNIGASVLATVVFTDLFGSTGLGIATGVMTFLVLVFGEITPKSFATKYAVGMSLFVAKPLYIMQIIFSPVIWILNKLVRLLMNIMGSEYIDEEVSEEEIKALIELGAEKGSIEKREKELLKNILQFNDITVEEVMTPRVSIDALPEESSLQEAIDFVIKKSHSRIPIYKDTIDNIVGIVTIKDILMLSEEYNDNKKLENCDLKKPLFVPVSKKIDILFKEFQKARTHIAIVIDEYGGTAGIVSLEDLLEEIVGEIIDESDIEEIPISKVSDYEIEAHGVTKLEDINDYLGINIKGHEREPISALILDKLNRFPKNGEIIKFPNAKVRVLKIHENKIIKVSVSKRRKK